MGNLLGTVTKIIPLALGLITAVEKIFGAGKGQEKKDAYLEGIMAALGVVESVTNKDLVDNAEFRTLLGNLADNVVSINNFIRDFRAKEAKEDA